MNDSILTFLQQLHGAMSNNEQFRVELTKNGDSMDMIIMPLMGDDESKVPVEAKPIRSALSMPLSMRNMSLDEMADDFSQRLSGYGQARSQANDAYQELLATLGDATASAKNSTSGKSNKQPQTIASGESTEPSAEVTAEATKTKEADKQDDSNNKPAGGLLNF